MVYIADAHCAEKWWNDERIKKRFARWGGGTGRYIAEAGDAILHYVGKADSYNIAFVAKALGCSPEELRRFAVWAYNDIPSPLEPWAGALLLAGVPPKAIINNFVDHRLGKTETDKYARKCLEWEQSH